MVNVTVRDKNGNFVRDLKPEDFSVLEDNKPQKVASFDIENTEAAVTQDVAQVKVLGNAVSTSQPAAATVARAFKDRRLVILFFDLSSMEPDEIERSAAAAQTLRRPANVPGRPGRGGFPGRCHRHRSGFHLRQSGVEEGIEIVQRRAPDRVSKPATPAPRKARRKPVAHSQLTILSSISSTPTADWKRFAPSHGSFRPIDQKKSLISLSSGMTRTGIENNPSFVPR